MNVAARRSTVVRSRRAMRQTVGATARPRHENAMKAISNVLKHPGALRHEPDGPAKTTAARAAAPLRFGRFELQAVERRLLVDGAPASLGGRAFDLLLALADRPGQLVGKHALMDLVWPGLVVEENNLAAQVSALRKVVGNDVIATIPGRGYRFVAPIESASPGAAPDRAGAGADDDPGRPPRLGRFVAPHQLARRATRTCWAAPTSSKRLVRWRTSTD